MNPILEVLIDCPHNVEKKDFTPFFGQFFYKNRNNEVMNGTGNDFEFARNHATYLALSVIDFASGLLSIYVVSELLKYFSEHIRNLNL